MLSNFITKQLLYKNNFAQNRYRYTSRDRKHYERSTTPHNYTRSRCDNCKRESRSYRSPYKTHRSPYRGDSRPRYRSRSSSIDNNFTNYTSSCGHSSRPTNSRFSRSRSHSNTRNTVTTGQTHSINDPLKFNVHTYHPTEMANALTPTSWFYSPYSHTSERHNKSDYPSRLEKLNALNAERQIERFFEKT